MGGLLDDFGAIADSRPRPPRAIPRRRRIRWSQRAGTLLLAAALAGCGGSSPTPIAANGCRGVRTAKHSASLLVLFGATDRLTRAAVCAQFGRPQTVTRGAHGQIKWRYPGGRARLQGESRRRARHVVVRPSMRGADQAGSGSRAGQLGCSASCSGGNAVTGSARAGRSARGTMQPAVGRYASAPSVVRSLRSRVATRSGQVMMAIQAKNTAPVVQNASTPL
jgi:hypothetical protein